MLSSYKRLSYLFLIYSSVFTTTNTTPLITYDTTHNIITLPSFKDNNVINIYESWLVKYNETYNVSGEKETRLELFRDNVKFIDEWNSNESTTYKLGLNKFADLSNDEFLAIYFGLKRKPVLVEWTDNLLPVNVDWREEQGHSDDDETVLMQKTVANLFVSVAFEATGRDFQFYKSGVFTGGCGTSLDNDMMVLGDGTTNDGIDYWIVNTSFGTDWGENGYIRMVKCHNNEIHPSNLANTIQNPPNQAPEVACDSYNSCPSRTTCCCVNRYGPYCLAWGCCPFQSAVCCDDRSRCCPRDYPICDSSKKICRRKNSPLKVKALKRTPACNA